MRYCNHWPSTSIVVSSFLTALVLLLSLPFPSFAGPLNGEVVSMDGSDVTVKLESTAMLKAGDPVAVSYMAGMLETQIGAYKITNVKGKYFIAQVVSSSMPPRTGMKVLVYLSRSSQLPAGPISSSPVNTNEVNKILQEGIAYENQGQSDAAITSFRKVMSIDPSNAFARIGLGLTYAKKGQLDEAMGYYNEAIRLEPGFAPAHYNLSVVYGYKGRYDAAKASLTEAVRLNPDFIEAHYELGLACNNLKDRQGAMAQYQWLKDRKPDLAQKLYTTITWTDPPTEPIPSLPFDQPGPPADWAPPQKDPKDISSEPTSGTAPPTGKEEEPFLELY